MGAAAVLALAGGVALAVWDQTPRDATALLSLSLPPVDLGWVALVALVPLLWLVCEARPARGFVLGVVFGAAVDDPDTGFVLTATEVSRQMAKVDSTQPVPTGACIT